MDRERCYVCRLPIPAGQVSRRVMTTAHYTGGNMGSASGVFSFTRSEVVSLCEACDATEACRLAERPGCLLKAVVAWLVISFCVSAFLNGYWILGMVCTSLVCWRRRRTATAVPADLPGQATRTPPLLHEWRFPGDADD